MTKFTVEMEAFLDAIVEFAKEEKEGSEAKKVACDGLARAVETLKPALHGEGRLHSDIKVSRGAFSKRNFKIHVEKPKKVEPNPKAQEPLDKAA